MPWKQRRGYATQALREVLLDASAEGLRYVDITPAPTIWRPSVSSQRTVACSLRSSLLRQRLAATPNFGTECICNAVPNTRLPPTTAGGMMSPRSADYLLSRQRKARMNLSAVRIFVTDMAGARRFYEDRLGLTVMLGDHEHGVCVFDAGSAQLIVEAVPKQAPPDEQVLVGRFTGVSFAVDDIVSKHQDLHSLGWSFPSSQSNSIGAVGSRRSRTHLAMNSSLSRLRPNTALKKPSDGVCRRLTSR